MTAHLIVNADDFGLSSGVNEGIVEAHLGGIVTSTSLMPVALSAMDAAELARQHPMLSVGLHWVGDGRLAPSLDLDDVDAVRKALARQLAAFRELMGRDPTHLDSHNHVHSSEKHLTGIFRGVAESLGIPLRGDGTVACVGGFYAQWDWGVTQLEHVSVEFLQWILREEVARDGWTEVSCHPARITGDFESVYLTEREVELRTLTDPRIRETIDQLEIELASYHDWACGRRSGPPSNGS